MVNGAQMSGNEFVPVARRTFLQLAGTGGALVAGAMVHGGCATASRLGADMSTASHGLFSVRRFGALGDGKTDDTEAFQAALDSCHQNGGGTVVVPAGRYAIRPIAIKSHTTFRLQAGAFLQATRRLEDYTKTDHATSHESVRVGLIRAEHAENIAIVGRGVVDGQASYFVSDDLTYPGKDFDRSVTRQGENFMPPGKVFKDGPYRRGDDRPGNLVYIRDCRNVHLEGVTLQNSPTWTSHFEECQDVLISGLHINTRAHECLIPNDDGIDIERCQRVRIVGCDIETGDDNIAIFSSEDVLVSNCTLRTKSTGVRVGYNGGDLKIVSLKTL